MTGFFGLMAARATGRTPRLHPRIVPRFEGAAATGGAPEHRWVPAGGLGGVGDPPEAPRQGAVTRAPAAHGVPPEPRRSPVHARAEQLAERPQDAATARPVVPDREEVRRAARDLTRAAAVGPSLLTPVDRTVRRQPPGPPSSDERPTADTKVADVRFGGDGRDRRDAVPDAVTTQEEPTPEEPPPGVRRAGSPAASPPPPAARPRRAPAPGPAPVVDVAAMLREELFGALRERGLVSAGERPVVETRHPPASAPRPGTATIRVDGLSAPEPDRSPATGDADPSASSTAPHVHLHIDRVSVARAAPPAPAQAAAPAPKVDHAAYLARRRGRR